MEKSLSNFYLILYISAWFFTIIIYHKKKKHFDVGSLILFSYLIYSIFSFLLFNNQYIGEKYNELKLFPFVYLFLMLIIAIYPVLKYDDKNIIKIQQPNIILLNSISIFIITVSLVQIPNAIISIPSNFVKVVTSSKEASLIYSENSLFIDTSGAGISNIFSIFTGMFSEITFLIFIYYLTIKNKNKFIVSGLLISCIYLFISSINSINRGGIVNILFSFSIAFLALRNFIPKQIKIKISVFFIFMVTLSLITLTAITGSRFSSTGTFDSIQSYTGQCNLNFNNYCLDAGGIRYGDRTLNLFKRILFKDTPKNYYERRQKYQNLKIDDYNFYTFVGDFTLDFGPVFSFFIFISFSLYALINTRIVNGVFFFHQLILIYFIMCVCMQGGMYLFPFSDTSNLKIIAFILLYFIFKFDYFKNKQFI